MIDCAIEDEGGRTLWKTHFNRRDQLLWREDFAPVLAQFLDIHLPDPGKGEQHFFKALDATLDTPEWRCLHALLAEKTKDGDVVVSLEKFGQVLNWFGPLKDSSGQKLILNIIRKILENDWFHGDTEYEKAVTHLCDKPPGTFLIRFSSKEHPGCFTISKVSRNSRIIHQRILHKGGSSFSTQEGKSYPTLLDLVLQGRDELKLETPCPGSPYKPLFNVKANVNQTLYDPTNEDS